MQPIEGIDLKVLSDEVKARMLQEKKDEVKTKIHHILGGCQAAEGTVRKLGEQLDKANQALEKARTKLRALESGDWNIISDTGPKDQNGPEKQEEK